MKKLFEKKINIVLMVVLAILIVVTIVAMIIWLKTSASANQEVSLEDKLNSRKYFESLAVNLDVKRVKRDGIEDLIEFLEKSDFFKAPASTKFHGDHEPWDAHTTDSDCGICSPVCRES